MSLPTIERKDRSPQGAYLCLNGYCTDREGRIDISREGGGSVYLPPQALHQMRDSIDAILGARPTTTLIPPYLQEEVKALKQKVRGAEQREQAQKERADRLKRQLDDSTLSTQAVEAEVEQLKVELSAARHRNNRLVEKQEELRKAHRALREARRGYHRAITSL